MFSFLQVSLHSMFRVGEVVLSSIDFSSWTGLLLDPASVAPPNIVHDLIAACFIGHYLLSLDLLTLNSEQRGSFSTVLAIMASVPRSVDISFSHSDAMAVVSSIFVSLDQNATSSVEASS